MSELFNISRITKEISGANSLLVKIVEHSIRSKFTPELGEVVKTALNEVKKDEGWRQAKIKIGETFLQKNASKPWADFVIDMYPEILDQETVEGVFWSKGKAMFESVAKHIPKDKLQEVIAQNFAALSDGKYCLENILSLESFCGDFSFDFLQNKLVYDQLEYVILMDDLFDEGSSLTNRVRTSVLDGDWESKKGIDQDLIDKIEIFCERGDFEMTKKIFNQVKDKESMAIQLGGESVAKIESFVLSGFAPEKSKRQKKVL